MLANPDGLLSDLAPAHEASAREAKRSAPSSAAFKYHTLDDAFHLTFFKHCNNAMLSDAYELFRPRIQTLRVNSQRMEGYLGQRVSLASSKSGEGSHHRRYRNGH